MKKIFIYAVILLAFTGLLAGCEKKEIASFEFSENNLVVLKGADITDLKFTPIYKDESRGTAINLTTEMITGYDKTKTGMQTIKATHLGFEAEYNVFVADKIVTTAAELRSAINTQTDGIVVALKQGIYDINREDDRTHLGNSNYYFLITAKNSIWRGFGNVTVKSTIETESGVLSTQNFVTIVGDGVEINNINLQSKKEANKVIEIYGKNAIIRNLTISPIDTAVKFAGSIYLHTNEGNTIIEDVTLNYGRITTTYADEDATLTLRNVTIDSAGSVNLEENTELDLWGFRNSAGITVTATNCTITVSAAFKAASTYQAFTAQLPTGITIVQK